MHVLKTGLFAALAIGTLIFPSSVSALAVPPVPTDVPIIDKTNTLNSEQTKSLAATIAAERSSTGNQIGILMIPSLEGDSLESFSLNVARTWGIGQKDRNSGVLLLIVKDERKLRIEVGYGLEGVLTDARSGQIIRNRIAPEFRQGKYYEGIKSGLDGIIAAIHNEADPALATETQNSLPTKWTNYIEPIIFALLFVPMWLGAILGRSKSWWAGGVLGGIVGGIIGLLAGFLFTGIIAVVGLVMLGLLFDWAVSRNFHQHATTGSHPSWWAGGGWGGGSSGSSGGGFGGFSGGSFGGGGSSGSW